MRKRPQPQSGMHAKHPMIERNQFRVLPIRIHEVNQICEFLKAEEEKQMRVPATPETPKFRRESHAGEFGASFGARGHTAQQKNKYSHNRLRADQFPRMKKVFAEC